ncbi:hypothetical protein E7Y31_23255, partial [Candidatus Frankia alpina]
MTEPAAVEKPSPPIPDAAAAVPAQAPLSPLDRLDRLDRLDDAVLPAVFRALDAARSRLADTA